MIAKIFVDFAVVSVISLGINQNLKNKQLVDGCLCKNIILPRLISIY